MRYIGTVLLTGTLAAACASSYGEIRRFDTKDRIEFGDYRIQNRKPLQFCDCELVFIDYKNNGNGIDVYSVMDNRHPVPIELANPDIKVIASQIEADYNEQEAAKQKTVSKEK